MFFHEHDAGINVLNHLPERIVIDQATRTRGVEAPGGIVEIGIVVQVGSNIISQVLKSPLLFEKVFALRLEGRCLGFHGLERVGERREELQGRIGIVDQSIEMALRECELIPV